MPTVALPPITPFTFQTSPWLLVLLIVGTNVCVPPPACAVALAGDSNTLIRGVIVTVAAADFNVSATSTAVTVTAAGVGASAGAV